MIGALLSVMACGGSNTGFQNVPPDVVDEDGTGVATIFPDALGLPFAWTLTAILLRRGLRFLTRFTHTRSSITLPGLGFLTRLAGA